ncbi:transcriptional regulator NrdR [Laspinema olomoucense]|uniref:Transcriptional repressor NrdR n=1 Tax=Laspinema olomoucense D3b TaxID=2953688 RepID=A0ABT2NGP1_9CYAN|nr:MULTISPECIES: transcriptional regulator NrdR [unclassified Laspinema]MCT7980910.1 transcriptional regulator NrdR [Laspinema sp. D3b]MCT7995169.1 transcriptional regulator NrdR [Laspinema sp. D3c]
MRCPFCQHTDSRVLESRSAEAGQSVRRRRECLLCNRRFTTYERIEYVPITVIKRDGSRESFDRSKLLRGIVRACEKTGVEAGQIENLVDEIEAQLQQQRFRREVTSNDIGELVLSQLQEVSEVAYIRFASVYRQFQGIRDFVDTLKDLQNQSDRQSTEHSPTPEEDNSPRKSPDDPGQLTINDAPQDSPPVSSLAQA